MKKANIKLSTIEDVRDFVNTASKYTFEIDLSSGRYIVDAKSIMGIFSLDLMNPIELTVHSDEADGFLDEIKKFIVE